MSWWRRFLAWLGFAPAPPNALEAMRDIQRQKRGDEPAPASWVELNQQLKTQVFSANDRRRLWTRHWRRRVGGDPRPLDEIRTPTDDEIAVLTDLVKDLGSGR